MTWQDLQENVTKLSKKIEYSPDIVVGIARGGIVPARLLSTRLKVRDMYCLNVKKIETERKVTTEILDNLSGKQILLVEDMLETGKSLIAAKKYLEAKGAVIKTACLYAMPISEIKPDYFLEEKSEVIHFPWE